MLIWSYSNILIVIRKLQTHQYQFIVPTVWLLEVGWKLLPTEELFQQHLYFLVICADISWHLCLLGDMYNHEDEMDEPDWVATEREQFSEFRDKNKDGKMDREETMDWILPADYDHAEAEAKHLVYESDSNKVGFHLVL